jgi:hypothetical protein
VAAAGVLTVAIAGTVSLRRSKTAKERTFHISHSVSFFLSFLIFLVVSGIPAVLGVLDDPLLGQGPTFPLEELCNAICGASHLRV